VTSIIFKNGHMLTIPKIQSYGGWVYRPNEARTQSDIDRAVNKTFSRTTKTEAPTAWMRQWFQNNLDRLGWPEIQLVEKAHGEWEAPSTTQGMQVAFNHPNLSWQSLRLVIEKDSEEPGYVNLQLAWGGLNIQQWYNTRRVPQDISYSNPILTQELGLITKKRLLPNTAYEFAARFGHNPVKVAKQHWASFPVDTSPPMNWDAVEPQKSRYGRATSYEQEPGVVLSTDQSHVFWRNRKHAKRVLIKSEATLRELASALDHHGVVASLQTSVIYDRSSEDYGKSYLDTARFTIPPSSDDANRLGHTFEFTQRGMAITCGYQEDEEKWEEMQKRHMTDWIAEMKDSLTIDEYEDYEITPNPNV
jgi:hypothetical protein